ncbi:MAG: methyl-accepting chemotaxis protein [Sterolibacteriaceae bacterium]|nr:methyl-accepting chemotaxis protein [Candidatus Methylophosphatis haderslevensis]
MFWRSKTIRTPLLFASAVGTLLLVAALAIALASQQSVIGRFSDFLATDQALLQHVDQMYAQGLQSGQALRNIILDPANKTAYGNLDKAIAQFEKSQQEAVALVDKGSAAEQALQQIATDWTRNNAVKARIKSLAATDQAEAVRLLNSDETPVWRQIKDALLKLKESQSAHVQEDQRQMLQNGRNALMASLAAAGLAMLAGFGIMLYVVERHRRALAGLEQSMQRISDGDGDLTLRLPVTSSDEAGRTAEAFNRFLDRMQRTICDVHEQAERVAASSGSLSKVVGEVSESSQQQSDSASAIAASIQQLIVSIASVAESAGTLREHSTVSLDTARHSNASLARLLQEIAHIDHTGRDIEQSVEEYVERTRTISSLTGNVKEIAGQTNLLALNAAIEAARAGEQGRGFAVVADEVRSLAEKSGQTAVQIESVTQAIGTQSETLIGAVKANHALLEHSATILREVSEALASSMAAVERSHQGVDQITSAVLEQKHAGHEIANRAENIARLAERNNGNVGNTAASSRELEAVVDNLRANVRRFKVG